MKKKIWIGIGIIVLIFLGYAGYQLATTRSHSPADTATYDKNGLTLQVDYCRPYKKGRLIFGPESEGALQPYGQYWRAGANEATHITFNQDVNFGGKPVKAGTYALYAVPGEDRWTIALNSEYDRWGATEPDYDKDVVSVDAVPETTAEVQEQFLITFEEGGDATHLVLHWDQTKVSIPIRVA